MQIAAKQPHQAGQVRTVPVTGSVSLHGAQDPSEDQATVKTSIVHHQFGVHAGRIERTQLVQAPRIRDHQPASLQMVQPPQGHPAPDPIQWAVGNFRGMLVGRAGSRDRHFVMVASDLRSTRSA